MFCQLSASVSNKNVFFCIKVMIWEFLVNHSDKSQILYKITKETQDQSYNIDEYFV